MGVEVEVEVKDETRGELGDARLEGLSGRSGVGGVVSPASCRG